MVHTYSLNGFNIALDVFSGAVHVCDPVSLEAISGTAGQRSLKSFV
jgi:hypothetical protein